MILSILVAGLGYCFTCQSCFIYYYVKLWASLLSIWFPCSFYSSLYSWLLDCDPDPSSYAVKHGVFREVSKGSWSQKITCLSECLLIFLNLSFFLFFFFLFLRNYQNIDQISTCNLSSLPRPGYFFQQGQCATDQSVWIVSVGRIHTFWESCK